MRDDAAEFRAWEAVMDFQVPLTGLRGRPVTTIPVARALGVSTSSVHRLRAGTVRPNDTLRQLMHVLRWCKERGLHPPI